MSTKAMAKAEQQVSPAIIPAFGPALRPPVFSQDVGESSTRSGFGHDFAQISVQPKAQSVQPGMESCPLSLGTPQYCPFGGACHTCPAPVQAKLTINEPGDKYEQEADRIADQVMRMPEPGIQMKPT